MDSAVTITPFFFAMIFIALVLLAIVMLGQLYLLLFIYRKLEGVKGESRPFFSSKSSPPPEEQIIAPSEEERDLLEWERERKSKEVS